MDWDKSKQCVWIKYEEKSQENSARVKLPIISNTMERRVLTDPNEIVRRRIAGKLYRIAQKYG